MDPEEFWWYVDAKRTKKTYGDMDEDEVAEIYEETYGPKEVDVTDGV